MFTRPQSYHCHGACAAPVQCHRLNVTHNGWPLWKSRLMSFAPEFLKLLFEVYVYSQDTRFLGPITGDIHGYI